VILGTQRTGTTLVRTSLSSHPDIRCVGEAFKLGKKPYKEAGGFWHYSHRSIADRLRSIFLPGRSTLRYLDDLFADPRYEAIGFKLMLNQCRSRPYLWPALRDRNIRALLVSRRNVLKTLLSRLTAAQSGVYHVSKTLEQPTAVSSWKASRIHVDPSTVNQKLDAIESEHDDWLSMLSDVVPYCDIVYEDYVADMEAFNRSILDFLDVRYRPLHSDLRKVNPDKLEDIIENYDEIAATLAGTRHIVHLAP
jgi:hypothetical protein